MEASPVMPVSAEAETIETRFGTISVRRDHAIRFPEGLLGMPEMQDFCIADFPSPKMRRFKLLQCLNDPTLAFITLPLVNDGSIIALEDISEALDTNLIPLADATVLLIVSVHRSPDAVQLSVNARAPVVIDTVRRAAAQHVFHHEKYQIRHFIS